MQELTPEQQQEVKIRRKILLVSEALIPNIEKCSEFSREVLTKSAENIVRKPRKNRSLNQNNYYHGVVVKMIADELGYENPNDVHMELRRLFLKVSDKPLLKTRSTTTLTTSEMEDYLAKIRIWALSELNITIPLPNEVEMNG